MDTELKVVLQVTRHAERELKKGKVTSKTLEFIKNKCISIYRNTQGGDYHKLNIQQFNDAGIKTTLYAIKLNYRARVIVSVDYDELFEQLIITIYGYTIDHNYNKIISNITESFYQKNKFLEINGDRYAD